MIRFVVDIQADHSCLITCKRLPDWKANDVKLNDQTLETLLGDKADPNKPWYDTASLSKLRRAIDDWSNPKNSSSIAPEKLSRFLMQGLLNEQVWAELCRLSDHVDTTGQEGVELAIRTQPDCINMHSVPWELICSEWPLGNRPVTVTRLVSSTAQAPPQLSWPPRILFVTSSGLQDQELLPALEAMGLLSHFDLASESTLSTSIVRPDLPSQILENATLSKLKKTIASFQPQIVYIACHGIQGELYFSADKENRSPNAAALADCLCQSTYRPSLVIVAACDSATSSGPNFSGSLVAELVALGLPIVIGMAGKISSIACRLFTRALADAILKNSEISLVESLCMARSAAQKALGLAPPAQRIAEWALPSLFMSDDDSLLDFRVVGPGALAQQHRINERASALDFKQENNPVFCCRDDLKLAYEAAVESESRTWVLAISLARGMGMSRALREVGLWALRDGHIPFPLLLSAKRCPTSAHTLGETLLDSLIAVQVAYQINPSQKFVGQLLKTLVPEVESTIATSWISDLEYQRICKRIVNLPESSLTLMEVRAAFGLDAAELTQLIVEKWADEFSGRKAKAILLLDNCHYYLPLLLELFENADVRMKGFGVNESIPVFAALQHEPAVTTKIDEDAAINQMKNTLLGDMATSPKVKIVPLRRFPDGIASQLAYERVLLHPYNDRISVDPLCFKPSCAADVVSLWRSTFHLWLNGIPAKLGDETMELLVRQVRDIHQVVEAANDAQVLQQYLTELRQL